MSKRKERKRRARDREEFDAAMNRWVATEPGTPAWLAARDECMAISPNMSGVYWASTEALVLKAHQNPDRDASLATNAELEAAAREALRTMDEARDTYLNLHPDDELSRYVVDHFGDHPEED